LGRGSELAPLPAVVQGHPLTDAASGPGLYVHVPFCRVRCPYCDFATAPYARRSAERYVSAVLVEAERSRAIVGEAAFTTCFYGGGTPSRLEPEDFARLAAGLARRLDLSGVVETTLEANPEDVDGERLAAWRAGGVNRLSLGVQSLDAGELARLGRPHGVDGALAATAAARRHFASWSLDLMYGFPGHTAASWERTLARALAEEPPHVSAYHFTAEAGTPMGEAVRAGRVRVADEDEAGELFEAAARRLGEAGYRHYEISNYARPGAESKHNGLYWSGAPYWGLGPSAVSTWERVRRTNVRDAAVYAARLEGGGSAVERVEDVGRSAPEELVMMGLRRDRGVAWTELAGLGARAESWRRAALAAGRAGWLEADETGFRLPAKARALTDEAVARLWRAVEMEV